MQPGEGQDVNKASQQEIVRHHPSSADPQNQQHYVQTPKVGTVVE